jgi:RNA-binding protein
MKAIMERLPGFQKRFLRSQAHTLKPIVFVGQKGLTGALVDAINEALDRHELIKVKFVECKEKEKKLVLVEKIESTAPCEMVGLVGHTAIFYRRQGDPQKRKIELPQRSTG